MPRRTITVSFPLPKCARKPENMHTSAGEKRKTAIHNNQSVHKTRKTCTLRQRKEGKQPSTTAKVCTKHGKHAHFGRGKKENSHPQRPKCAQNTENMHTSAGEGGKQPSTSTTTESSPKVRLQIYFLPFQRKSISL